MSQPSDGVNTLYTKRRGGAERGTAASRQRRGGCGETKAATAGGVVSASEGLLVQISRSY